MKDTVLMEGIANEQDSLVSVVPFDLENEIIIGGTIEVLTRSEAMGKYEVVGEIVNSEIIVFGKEKEDDYNEFFSGEDYYEE